MNEIPRQKLQELIRRFGVSLVDDPNRCKGMLKDLCGEYRKEIAGLIAALEEGIVNELLKPNILVDIVRGRLTQKLQDERGLMPEVALWSVDAWALALNLITVAQLRPLSNTSSSLPNSTHQPPSPPLQPVIIVTQQVSYTVVTVNEQGQVINQDGAQNQCFIEQLDNGIELEMMQIPNGTFIMGSPESEEGHDSRESPLHLVNLNEFWMAKYPITQIQYQAVTGKNPSRFKGSLRPVEMVSWQDAQQFCQKLSILTNKNYRLPSEAEWEYACRAGTSTPFYFGETIRTDLSNYGANSSYGRSPRGVNRSITTEVGTFPPNLYGLHDMHGNVWEWCEDAWHTDYQDAPNDGSAWLGENKPNSLRSMRGGSWFNDPKSCRSAHRFSFNANIRDNTYGFRVVLSLLS